MLWKIISFFLNDERLSACLFPCLKGFIGENTSKVFHIFQKILVAPTMLALLIMSRRASGCVREQGRSSSPLQGQGQVARCSSPRSQMVVTRSNVLCCAVTTTSVTPTAHTVDTLYVRYHEQKCEWFALSEELITHHLILERIFLALCRLRNALY